jgi:chemotaxis protein MotB
VPIHTEQYPTNWELSTQRAVNVLKIFVQVKGQNPQRFQAAGYGEYRPIAPMITMQTNQRIKS